MYVKCSMKKYVVVVFYANGSGDEFYVNAESVEQAEKEFAFELEVIKNFANVVDVEYFEETQPNEL